MNKRIIYTNNQNKLCVLIPAPDSGLSIEEIAQKDVPAGFQYSIVEVDNLPQDRTFRAAWEEDSANAAITINVDTAKDVTHTIRRDIRAKEFEPYDKIISLQIPGNDSADAETKRAEIRAKYEVIQQDIDNASTVDQLKQIVDQLKQ